MVKQNKLTDKLKASPFRDEIENKIIELKENKNSVNKIIDNIFNEFNLKISKYSINKVISNHNTKQSENSTSENISNNDISTNNEEDNKNNDDDDIMLILRAFCFS